MISLEFQMLSNSLYLLNKATVCWIKAIGIDRAILLLKTLQPPNLDKSEGILHIRIVLPCAVV